MIIYVYESYTDYIICKICININCTAKLNLLTLNPTSTYFILKNKHVVIFNILLVVILSIKKKLDCVLTIQFFLIKQFYPSFH